MTPPSLNEEKRAVIAVENIARTSALELLGGKPRDAAVVCGNQESGACGLSCARHLHNYGFRVRTGLGGLPDRARGVCATELRPVEETGIELTYLVNDARRAGFVERFVEGGVLIDATSEREGWAHEETLREALSECSPRAAKTVELTYSLDFRTPPPRPSAGDAVFSPGLSPRSRDECRMMDAVAIERLGIPSVALMENAGWRAARECFLMLKEPEGAKVLVVCGRGNNGGDGFVLARHLDWWGVSCEVFLLGERDSTTYDAHVNLKLLEECGPRVKPLVPEGLKKRLAEATLVADALLGTGLRGDVKGPAREAIELINASGKPVLAVDTPSGLDCDRGEPLGVCVRAVKTVTFAAPKLGFERGGEHVGELVVADISMPRDFAPGGGAGRDHRDTESRR